MALFFELWSEPSFSPDVILLLSWLRFQNLSDYKAVQHVKEKHLSQETDNVSHRAS
jgi:hypothetical protein